MSRSDWANIGRGFRDLGTQVGKTVVKTVKEGTQKIEDWAYEDDKKAADNTQKQAPVAEATVVDDTDN